MQGRAHMTSGTKDIGLRWARRISRAQALQSNHHTFAEALPLYEAILRCQSDIALAATSAVSSEVPLRAQIDVSFACSQVPFILSAAIKHGPEALHGRAQGLQSEGEPIWRALIESALDNRQGSHSEIDDCIFRACLQPIAENVQSQLPVVSNYSRNRCPACDGLPQLAILRPEGEGGSRWLLCSFCLCEWAFRRIICPWCGEEDKEKLPRYSAEECPHLRVEACDTCKRYLKEVDMTIDGNSVPLVDEAAFAVLDIWATGHGYTKISKNLIGF
jgi:FdhE protein